MREEVGRKGKRWEGEGRRLEGGEEVGGRKEVGMMYKWEGEERHQQT